MHGETVYCPFDPALTIDGERLKFIVNIANDPAILHFKELGRFISVDLKEDKIKSEIRRRVFSDMETVEASGINGLRKLYLPTLRAFASVLGFSRARFEPVVCARTRQTDN